MSGTLTRVAVISMMIYLAITIFMHDVVQAYFAGSPTASAVNSAIGISVGDNSVGVDLNSSIAQVPTPATPGVLDQVMSFLAPILAVMDYVKKIGMIALTPALLLALPDSVIPAAIKIFVLLPTNLLVFISIVAFIRGYTL